MPLSHATSGFVLQSAIASGKVRFTACTMSMEASEQEEGGNRQNDAASLQSSLSSVGVAPSTLIPGVELGGVADFLATAANAKTTLFI